MCLLPRVVVGMDKLVSICLGVLEWGCECIEGMSSFVFCRVSGSM